MLPWRLGLMIYPDRMKGKEKGYIDWIASISSVYCRIEVIAES